MEPVKSALNIAHRRFCFWGVALLLCICPTFSHAKGIVAGQYLSARGQEIALQLTLKSEVPLTIIVEQVFTAKNEITETRPTAKKINPDGKKIKWLLKKKKKGTIKLRTRLGRPLKGKVKAVIRYRSPKDGKLVELKVNS